MNNVIEYLGDGVYAEYDGVGCWLRTGDHQSEKCSNEIYLEYEIVCAFYDFYTRVNGTK